MSDWEFFTVIVQKQKRHVYVCLCTCMYFNKKFINFLVCGLSSYINFTVEWLSLSLHKFTSGSKSILSYDNGCTTIVLSQIEKSRHNRSKSFSEEEVGVFYSLRVLDGLRSNFRSSLITLRKDCTRCRTLSEIDLNEVSMGRKLVGDVSLTESWCSTWSKDLDIHLGMDLTHLTLLHLGYVL